MIKSYRTWKIDSLSGGYPRGIDVFVFEPSLLERLGGRSTRVRLGLGVNTAPFVSISPEGISQVDIAGADFWRSKEWMMENRKEYGVHRDTLPLSDEDLQWVLDQLRESGDVIEIDID